MPVAQLLDDPARQEYFCSKYRTYLVIESPIFIRSISAFHLPIYYSIEMDYRSNPKFYLISFAWLLRSFKLRYIFPSLFFADTKFEFHP